MVEIDTSIVIKRPVKEVFEFMANPENDVLWQSGVLESRKTSEGPMGVGTTEVSESQIMGRRIRSTYEVTIYELNNQIEYTSTSGPLQVKATYSFETTPEGDTKVRITGEVEVGGFFKLAEPIVAMVAQRQWDTNIANLKDLLEAQS